MRWNNLWFWTKYNSWKNPSSRSLSSWKFSSFDILSTSSFGCVSWALVLRFKSVSPSSISDSCFLAYSSMSSFCFPISWRDIFVLRSTSSKISSFFASIGVANGKIRDAETLLRNPTPRLFGKKFRAGFRDSKKVKTNHAKARLRDLSKTLPRFRDSVKIFRDPRFSRYHSPPLSMAATMLSAYSCTFLFKRAACSWTLPRLSSSLVILLLFVWALFLWDSIADLTLNFRSFAACSRRIFPCPSWFVNAQALQIATLQILQKNYISFFSWPGIAQNFGLFKMFSKSWSWKSSNARA